MKKYLGITIILAACVFSFLIVAHAQVVATSTVSGTADSGSALQGITYPIPELGNCASQDECRTYCDNTANMDACIAFAKAHGLMNSSDATSAENFKTTLQTIGGPGGCKSPADCKAFCSDTANLAVCVQFAKSHGVNDANVTQGEKILAYMNAGGTMPGGCTSQDTCQAYCSDFSHAEECFKFAQAAGIAQGGGNASSTGNVSNIGNGSSTGNGSGEGADQQFLALVQAGQTPGGCTSKDTCEAYCTDASHRSECITFAVNAGFITQPQADLMNQSTSTGPGGCDSADSCKSYCDDDTHSDECLQYAQSRGLLTTDQVTQVQQGLTSLRAGLEQASSTVVNCLQASVGSSTVADIESGTLVPGSDVAATIRSCFQKFGSQDNPKQLFTGAPTLVKACLKNELGAQFTQIQNGTSTPTPEMADTFRICYQKIQLENGTSTFGKGGQGGNGSSTQGIQNFLRTAPAEILPCIKTALGADFNGIASGTSGIAIDTSRLKGCFEMFHPMNATGTSVSSTVGYPPGFHGNPGTGPEGTGTSTLPKPPGTASGNPIPLRYSACITSVLGDGGTAMVLNGQVTADQKAQIAQCVSASNTATGTSTAGQGGEPPQPQNAPLRPLEGGGSSAGNGQSPQGDQPPSGGGPTPDLSNPQSNAQGGSFLASVIGTVTGFFKSWFR